MPLLAQGVEHTGLRPRRRGAQALEEQGSRRPPHETRPLQAHQAVIRRYSVATPATNPFQTCHRLVPIEDEESYWRKPCRASAIALSRA